MKSFFDHHPRHSNSLRRDLTGTMVHGVLMWKGSKLISVGYSLPQLQMVPMNQRFKGRNVLLAFLVQSQPVEAAWRVNSRYQTLLQKAGRLLRVSSFRNNGRLPNSPQA